MQARSKMVLFLLSVMFLQPAVSLAADTNTTTNFTIKKRTTNRSMADLVKDASAPTTSAAIVPLTGVTKATIAPPRRNNIPPYHDACDPGYYCVVPSGQYTLATCFLGTGDSDCRAVYDRCIALRAIRARNETLSRDDDQFYDHQCKTP